MALTNDQITAQNFKDFYEQIRPYLNGSFPTPIVNKFSKGDLYSTDEKIVGQWIDGKPLYQKSVVNTYTTFPVGDNVNIILNDLSNDFEYAHIVRMDAYYDNGAIVSDMINTFKHSNSDYNIICFNLSHATNEILSPFVFFPHIGSNFNTIAKYKIVKIVTTIEYTKTTDTTIAIGDGNDYSTEEQVVGTWIDSKPLYQKTWTGLSVTVTTDNTKWQLFSDVVVPNGNLIDAMFLRNGQMKIVPQECWIRPTTGVLETLYWPESRTISDVTLRYTKTTD